MPYVIFGLCLALMLGTYAVYANWKRGLAKIRLPLQTNLLLTRFPIAFLSGQKSLFYFLGYWNWIPQCLRDHGYQVIELNFAKNRASNREEQIRKFLELCQAEGMKIHLIADGSSMAELEALADHPPPALVSLTCVNGSIPYRLTPFRLAIRELQLGSVATGRPALALRLHQWWRKLPKNWSWPSLGLASKEQQFEIQARYLKLASELAEFDLHL